MNTNIPINCTHFMTRVRSYSSCCTQVWNSTFSRRIHSSVITGIISWRPTTSFPCLHKSFTPSSTSGMPATLWYNLCSTGRYKLMLGRWSPLKRWQKVKFFLTKFCHCFAHLAAIPCLISLAVKHLRKNLALRKFSGHIPWCGNQNILENYFTMVMPKLSSWLTK